MAPHREFQYFIINVGTYTTHAQFNSISSLHELLPSKSISLPTKVYQHPNNEKNYYTSVPGNKEIKFIENGIITDLNAFNYYVKLVYKSLIKYNSEKYLKSNPESSIHSYELSLNVHLLVVTSTSVFHNFSKLDIQKTTNYLFENLDHIQSFTLISSALCLLFAHSNNANTNGTGTALVVDIGAEKVNILPVIEFMPISFANVYLPIGGNAINKNLQKLLPDLSKEQIETLKKSEIYEVLTNLNRLDAEGEDEKETMDVLNIVISNKPAELIEKRKKKGANTNEDAKEKKPNTKLESNTFVDLDGKVITVGKQRFQGAEDLITKIAFGISNSINKYPVFEKRLDLWSTIIVNGPVSGIKGFKEHLLEELISKFVSSNFEDDTDNPEDKFRATTNNDSQFSNDVEVKFCKKPEYFQDWKDIADDDINNDLTILGALVFVRLTFGPGSHYNSVSSLGNELYVIKKDDFEESGPNLIWEM